MAEDRDWRIERADSDARRADAFAVREQVFVEEQGVPPGLEYDDHDETPETTHLVAYRGGDPVGAARLRPYEGAERPTAKVERVAVLADHRGEGLGRALVVRVHETARERGFERAYLHAQTSVRAFYGGLGYETTGEEFEEAGIPHVAMERGL